MAEVFKFKTSRVSYTDVPNKKGIRRVTTNWENDSFQRASKMTKLVKKKYVPIVTGKVSRTVRSVQHKRPNRLYGQSYFLYNNTSWAPSEWNGRKWKTKSGTRYDLHTMNKAKYKGQNWDKDRWFWRGQQSMSATDRAAVKKKIAINNKLMADALKPNITK
jgi:hypothetical protein